MPIVASCAAMQASLLTAPGGSYFSSPLGVALSSYMEEPQCRAALLDALKSLAALPDIQRLAQPAAPDQQPETALVCSHSRHQEAGLQENASMVVSPGEACTLLLSTLYTPDTNGHRRPQFPQ